MSSQSMDSVDIVHGHYPIRLDSLDKTLWTLSRVSMDNVQTVHWVHGQCPLSPWTMSTESMDIVQSGWSHWTLSRVSIDIVQTINWVHGKCPLSPWTMSRESTESMDFLQTGFNSLWIRHWIRCCLLWCLICVCTVCEDPTYGMLNMRDKQKRNCQKKRI